MWTKIQGKKQPMIYVSTDYIYKLNLLHGATLAGVDSGFSTFILAPNPHKVPKIYRMTAIVTICIRKTRENLESQRENGFFQPFSVIWVFFYSERSTADPCFICEAEEISGRCDITRPWSVAMDRCVTTGSRIFSLRRRARCAEVSAAGGLGSEPAEMTNGDDLTDGAWKTWIHLHTGCFRK